MSVQYDIYQSPSSDGTIKKKYARPISLGTMDTKQLIEQICVNEGFIDVHEARKVVAKVCQAIIRAISDGYNVHIDEFGFFSPRLSTTWPDDKRRTTPDVTVEALNFVPEKEVKEELASIITNQIVTLHHTYTEANTDEKLDAILLAYLDEHTTITRKQLQSITPTLSRNAACAYLNRALERGVIRNIASKSNPVYMKA